MRALITSDTHFSSRPADAYRFGLFPWLRQQTKREETSHLFFLGDLTQEKDKHTAALVNRIVAELRQCAEVCDVVVLFGNHDGIGPDTAFFKFVGGFEHLRFIVKPTLLKIGTETVLMLPHSRQPEIEWADIDLGASDYILFHQTLRGAKAENGQVLAGISASMFKPEKLAISGDVHVPQKVGNVVYVGAPYGIHFGDSFTPRVLLIDGSKTSDLHFPAPRKRNIEVSSIKELHKVGLLPDDQVRLTLNLDRRDFDKWGEIRREALAVCEEYGVGVFGAEIHQAVERKTAKQPVRVSSRKPVDIVRAFGERRELADDVLAAGVKIVEGK